MGDKESKNEACRTCKGSGKQDFHGAFESYQATCNFCDGHGTREEEIKWFDKSFTGRGFGCVEVGDYKQKTTITIKEGV